ncbi:NAD(P)/FAD-dependent oxidoreductase [Chitinophaga sp. GCM10012297]|uniref:FAD-binding oxidoreductase n=1 Tax=Chitinophaga chungangae TaxID=2821488 RepID=A0ABS3YGM6_9BACT|nr:FAD-binding oxidoreductase [Chitinophaga chungangae]MBO9153443.1 FAD-binding oxidoreductase [Chitinophaga chungangae]
MQQYDYILVGQGIAGTMLGWFLQQAGQQVLVFDDARPASASRTAAGIINPVSGRRFETAWLYDMIYPFAGKTYRAMENALQISCFHERDIWNVWPSAQMRDAFAACPTPYSQQPREIRYAEELQQPFGAGIVKGANVQLGALLPAWRKTADVRTEHFDTEKLVLKEEGVEYENLRAKAVIFCEGVESPRNPWFGKLKFLPNKGEALIVALPFETTDIIKKSITLVPLDNERYWAGATFSWDYADAAPTAPARETLENQLRQLLKTDYQVLDHLAAIRPSGPDRRPMAGLHPRFPQVGIFNGMGSKGCSLAPWAADVLVKNLLQKAPLPPEIDIKRYFNALR